jgi:hypothetical protein
VDLHHLLFAGFDRRTDNALIIRDIEGQGSRLWN